jgi:hypothetical protein
VTAREQLEALKEKAKNVAGQFPANIDELEEIEPDVEIKQHATEVACCLMKLNV